MKYNCALMRGKQKEQRTGEIHVLKSSSFHYEAKITGGGTYFHVIAGRHLYGNYICIPNHDAGSELADDDDLFWNTERLSGHLRKADAVTVANGLCFLEKAAGAQTCQDAGQGMMPPSGAVLELEASLMKERRRS
jgi:hypothetical protein